MSAGSDHTRAGAQARLRMTRAILALGLLVLAGCKVVITVPPGGQVTSSLGTVCTSGQTCIVDVAQASHDETFTAVPASGYTFSHWKKAQGHLCGDNIGNCRLDAAGLAGTPQWLDADVNVYLEPVFESLDDGRYDLVQWQALLGALESNWFRSDNFLYRILPDANNCDPGDLLPRATRRFTDALNMVRQLHHLPAVDYDNFYDTQMQATNLVQMANDYFTHYPQPNDTCYTADAAAGAGSSNISWSSWQGDPARYALGWANDNHNISTLMAAGHRRWILYPNLGYTSYGQVRGYASMKVFNFGSAPGYTLPAGLEYVAFPYRNYPHVLVEKGSKPTPWSISMVPDSGSGNYGYFNNATVTVTEDASGNNLNVHSQYRDNIGYGLPNFLSWMVDNWQHDTDYTVTINHVQMPGGNVITISYPVHIDLEEFQ